MADDNDLHIKVERLSGRVDGVEIRIRPLEAWVEESKKFHQEMRTHWDHWDGMQEAEMKQQKNRHLFNATLLSIITILLAALSLYVAYKEYRDGGHASVLSIGPADVEHAQVADSWKLRQ
jgi:hypothetical protein